MEIFIIIVLILMNGVLSMSEIALVSARKSRLEADAKKGSLAAKTALNLSNEPDRFLSTIQIGITLIGILTGLYSGESLAAPFALILSSFIPSAYTLVVAQVIIVVVVTYLTLIIGELVPKRIGMAFAEKVSKLVARPMNLLSLLASPFVWLLSKSTKIVMHLLGLDKNSEENKVTEDEIKALIREGTEDGEVQEVEQDIVERVFNLGDRNIGSIMTHRNDLVWIDMNMSREELNKTILEDMYHVYPVSSGKLDNVLGVVFLKDIFGKIESSDFDISTVICPAHYMPETLSVYNALDKMRQNRLKYALVTDEFGSIQGIVTSSDIMEALIGTLPDAEEAPDIVVREDGSVLVDGQCSFYDFLAYYDLEELYPDYNYNTVSGLILERLEHIPRTGEKLHWLDFEIEVVDMDGARIDKILVTRVANVGE